MLYPNHPGLLPGTVSSRRNCCDYRSPSAPQGTPPGSSTPGTQRSSAGNGRKFSLVPQRLLLPPARSATPGPGRWRDHPFDYSRTKSTASVGKIQAQCFYDLLVQGNGLCLSGLLLCKAYMRAHSLSLGAINILPTEPEQITDSERRASAHDDHHIVAELSLLQKVIGQSLKLFFVADRFSCCHKIIPLILVYRHCSRPRRGVLNILQKMLRLKAPRHGIYASILPRSP